MLKNSEDLQALGVTETEISEDAIGKDIAAAEEKEEELYNQLAPTGSFKRDEVNGLIREMNAVLKLFEQEAYPNLTADIEKFPTDLTRVLIMISDAANMAASDGDIPQEDTFKLEDIRDSASMQGVAIKLMALGKELGFKRFLKKPPVEQVKAPEEIGTEKAGPSEADIESMFAQRAQI